MDSHFKNKKLYYTNLYDTESKLFRGKDTKGNFKNPFDALAATSPVNNSGDFTEVNAGQYFWTPAQYDVKGIIDLLGVKTNFTTQLNTFFTTETENPNIFLGQKTMKSSTNFTTILQMV